MKPHKLICMFPLIFGLISCSTIFKPEAKEPLINDNMTFLEKGIILEKNGDPKALDFYLLAAQEGNPEAQYRLANIYYSVGKAQNIPEYIKETYKWMNKAAKQGHAEAMIFIAEGYYYGVDVPQDRAKSFYIMSVACREYRHRGACFALDYLNYSGYYEVPASLFK